MQKNRLSKLGPLGFLIWLEQRLPIVFLMSILCLALLIRLPFFLSRPLWVDEVFQYDVVFASDITTFNSNLIATERNPPGLYLIQRGLTLVFNSSTFVLRFPSLIFGVATVGAGWLLGRIWFDRKTSVVMALLCCVSPCMVFYSREGRPYASGVFLITIFLCIIISQANRPSFWNNAFLTCFSCLCLFLQFANVVVVVIPLLISFLYVLSQNLINRSYFVGWVSAIVSSFGVLVFLTLTYMIPQMNIRGTGLLGADNCFFDFFSLESFISFFYNNCIGFFEYVFLCSSFSLGPRWRIICLIAWIPCFVGFYLTLKNPGRIQLLFGITILIIISFIVMAGLHLHPFGPIRHTLHIFPFLFLFLSVCLIRLYQVSFFCGEAIFFLIVFLMVYSNLFIIPTQHWNDVPGIVDELKQKALPNDQILVVGDRAPKVVEHYKTKMFLLNTVKQVSVPYFGELFTDTTSFYNSVILAQKNSGRFWLVEFSCETVSVNDFLQRVGFISIYSIEKKQVRATLWKING